MKFNKHYNYEGQHAMFSASKPAWLRYDDDRAVEAYSNKQAKEKGTRLHAVAKELMMRI